MNFTSYINNLHPKKHPEIYRTLERLIDAAIPAWDQCLREHSDFDSVGAGRGKSRFSQPEDCPDECVTPN